MSIMRKAYYYSFLPTKKEEIESSSPFLSSANRAHQVTRTLIEIRDDHPSPGIILPPTTAALTNPNFDPNNSLWRIRKRLDTHEIQAGKIHLTHYDVFEHVFRYASLESSNNVVTGKKVYVKVCDVTDENTPLVYGPFDEQTFFEKGLQDEYVLGLNMALVRSRGLKNGDEIGIFYDPRSQIFHFKVFR